MGVYHFFFRRRQTNDVRWPGWLVGWLGGCKIQCRGGLVPSGGPFHSISYSSPNTTEQADVY